MTAPRPTTAREDERAWQLVHELTTVLDDRMTKSGHPYALITQEGRGTCTVKECSLRCTVYRDLFVRATAWLEEHKVKTPAQLSLLDAGGTEGAIS